MSSWASFHEAGRISEAIANELRLTVTPGAALLDQVVEAITERHLLVVLDNCEHLVDEAAVVVERIAGVPAVDVLITSRVSLRADDERVVAVPADETSAVELFCDRLAAVTADDPVSGQGHEGGWPLDIVHRLDGLPLVLELAAARVPGLGLAGLRDALDEPFGVLSGGRPTGRHHSLLAVVEWSVDSRTPA